MLILMYWSYLAIMYVIQHDLSRFTIQLPLFWWVLWQSLMIFYSYPSHTPHSTWRYSVVVKPFSFSTLVPMKADNYSFGQAALQSLVTVEWQKLISIQSSVLSDWSTRCLYMLVISIRCPLSYNHLRHSTPIPHMEFISQILDWLYWLERTFPNLEGGTEL